MPATSDKRQSPAEIIRARRIEFGWTQEELAAEAGVSKATVQFIEGGRDFRVESTLAKLATALRMSPSDIVRWVA